MKVYQAYFTENTNLLGFDVFGETTGNCCSHFVLAVHVLKCLWDVYVTILWHQTTQIVSELPCNSLSMSIFICYLYILHALLLILYMLYSHFLLP